MRRRAGRSRAGREGIGVAVVCAVALAGVGAAPEFGPLVTLPAAFASASAVGVLLLWSRARRRLTVLACAAGVVSLAATAAVLLFGERRRDAGSGGGWILAESAALLVLTALTVRAARCGREAVSAAVAATAVPVTLTRFWTGPPSLAALGGGAFWTLLALLAVAVGLYLRSLDNARIRSVAEGRRAQRLQLARDLHDFVAHDVSEMLALAQAGQFLAEQYPGKTSQTAQADTFHRIEQAGLQALASLDRTVRMLHDDDEAADGRGGGAYAGGDRDREPAMRAPLPDVEQLPELVTRFSASSTARVDLQIDPELLDNTRRDVTTTAYRVVVEALTNVRRHAPGPRLVDVALHHEAGALVVTVTNDARSGTAFPAIGVGGGRGLRALTQRVEAIGGSLSAGPHDPPGWRVTAVLPLNPDGEGGRPR
ncbi:histidine kinase [Streptomyces sp. NPDC093990]|uniref:sensor histidine kinase n=1 Tax=Streptomyces sp. NPDC093990 TaxID=3155306 RepID=UPI00342D2F03